MKTKFFVPQSQSLLCALVRIYEPGIELTEGFFQRSVHAFRRETGFLAALHADVFRYVLRPDFRATLKHLRGPVVEVR